MESNMSSTKPSDERNTQRTDPEPESPIEDDLRERPLDIPSNVLSLDFSQHSDEELADMYESTRSTTSPEDDALAEMYESAWTTGSVEELEKARQRSLRGHTNDEFARRYRRARGGPVRPEDVNLLATADSVKSPPSITNYEVKEVIRDEFGDEGWMVMRPLLATHATLLLDDIESSRAMMVEGQSGVGKTMLLKTFGGLNEQFCRRSDVTPASFVSAGSSNSNGNSNNKDLLPQLAGRTLAVRDAQTLFAGSEQTVQSRWSKLARIMDGDGYYRHTATHGKVGYDDVRFNFIGATTPLSPRAGRMMGNVGQRLLFVEWPDEEYDDGWLTSVVDGGERQPIDRGRDVIQEFLRDLWDFHGGSSNIAWEDERRDEIIAVIEYLAEVVTFARASITNGEPQRESPKRIGQLLHDLARGHALIHGRTRLDLEDIGVCGRVALSTMPSKRRGAIRALLDPDTQEPLTPSEVEDILDVSRPTARDRIDEVAALGLGVTVDVPGRGGTTTGVRVKSEFRWPDELAFPEF